MKCKLVIAIAVVAFSAVVAPAFATPPGEQAVTDVPWGTTDSTPAGFGGGEGGPDMRITEQGHLNWPNFYAPVDGSTATAANAYQYSANVQTWR